jgi:hypothetical protein
LVTDAEVAEAVAVAEQRRPALQVENQLGINLGQT